MTRDWTTRSTVAVKTAAGFTGVYLVSLMAQIYGNYTNVRTAVQSPKVFYTGVYAAALASKVDYTGVYAPV